MNMASISIWFPAHTARHQVCQWTIFRQGYVRIRIEGKRHNMCRNRQWPHMSGHVAHIVPKVEGLPIRRLVGRKRDTGVIRALLRDKDAWPHTEIRRRTERCLWPERIGRSGRAQLGGLRQADPEVNANGRSAIWDSFGMVHSTKRLSGTAAP